MRAISNGHVSKGRISLVDWERSGPKIPGEFDLLLPGGVEVYADKRGRRMISRTQRIVRCQQNMIRNSSAGPAVLGFRI
jgi:hypothetical protein